MTLCICIWDFTFISTEGYRVDFGPWFKPIKMIPSCTLLHNIWTISAFTEIFSAVSQELLFKLKMSYLAFIQLPPSLLPKQSSKRNSPRKASKIQRGQESSAFLLGPGVNSWAQALSAWGYSRFQSGSSLLRSKEHRIWNHLILNVQLLWSEASAFVRCLQKPGSPVSCKAHNLFQREKQKSPRTIFVIAQPPAH